MVPDPLVRIISIPFLAGLVCFVLPRTWEKTRAWLSIAVCGITLFESGRLLVGEARTFEFSGWPLLQIDKLSGLMLVAASFFALLIAIYSLSYLQNIRGVPGQPEDVATGNGPDEKPSDGWQSRIYHWCLLASLAFSCIVFLANDLVVLLTAWGMLALTLYLMIGVVGRDAAEASRKTLVIVGGSDSLLLLCTALLWVEHGTTSMDAGALSLDSASSYLALVCLIAAVMAKVGAIPLHSWLPDFAEKAYAPVTAYLPASLDKLLGIYLLVRATMGLFGVTDGVSALLMVIGAVTILGGALMALVQQNLKRLLAYCAISQVGFIFLAIGTGTVAGLAGGLFHMLNHAICKSCLFLGAGVVEQKVGTVDLDRLGGLATRLPLTFAACLVAALSVSAIPPLNGFASKWIIYQSIIASGQDNGGMLWVVWLAVAMMGSALTMAVIVKLLHAVFLCKPSPAVRESKISRASISAVLPMALLAGLCVAFGVLANELPLRLLILPAVGEPVTFGGTWFAGQATILLLVAFLLGWLVYALTLRNGKLRKCPTFIGGENLDEARIPGVPAGAQRHVEVTGVDFYQTVQQLPMLKSLFVMARLKMFDIYSSTGKALAKPVRVLQIAHNGLLSFYLIWFLLGLLAIVYWMMEGTR